MGKGSTDTDEGKLELRKGCIPREVDGGVGGRGPERRRGQTEEPGEGRDSGAFDQTPQNLSTGN